MNKLLLIIILTLLICLHSKNENYTDMIIDNKNVSKYYTNPYVLSYYDEDILSKNIIEISQKYIPFEIVLIKNIRDRYNHFINNKSNMTIVNNRIIKKNDDFKLITNISTNYIYMIVKSNSNIYSFNDCMNKKVVIDSKNDITNSLARKIFNILEIDNINFIDKSNDDIEVINDFYFNNKYDAIFQENTYTDINNFYKDKNIRIVTGNIEVNGKNELDKIYELSSIDYDINNINKTKIQLINDFYSPLNDDIYEIFLSLSNVLICKEYLTDNYVYSLINVIYDKYLLQSYKLNYNIVDDINNSYIDKNIHNGALKYLEKNSFLSFNKQLL